MKKPVTSTIRLSKTGKRGKWMPLTITSMATAATGSNKDGTKPFLHGEYLVVKSHIACQKLPVLLVAKSANRPIQYFMICGAGRLQLGAGLYYNYTGY